MKQLISVIIAAVCFFNIIPYEVVSSMEVSQSIVNELKEETKFTIGDGQYTIENHTLHETKDQESIARKFVHKVTTVEVEQGKIYLHITMMPKNMVNNLSGTVNGKTVVMEKLQEQDDAVIYKIPIQWLQDNIVIGISPFPGMNVKFRFLLNIDTFSGEIIEVPEDKEEDKEEDNDSEVEEEPDDELEEEDKDNVTEKPDQVPGTKPEIKPEASLPTIPENIETENELYMMNNEILTDSPIGYNAARAVVNPTNYMEIIDNERHIILNLMGTNLLSNLRIYVDGKETSHVVLKDNPTNNSMDIKFKINNLGSSVNVKMYIKAIERDIDFGLDFLENTLKQIGFIPQFQPTDNNIIQQLSMVETTEVKEEYDEGDIEEENLLEAKGNGFRKYKVLNEVISDSSVGQKMTRKYLNEVSILEETQDKTYVTFRFSGTDLMDDFKIAVNGKEVTSELTDYDKERNVKAYKVEIENINDDITVYAHIKPMGMNIDFGVKLIEDTKELIEEYIPEDKVVDSSIFTKIIGVTVAALTLIIVTIIFIVVRYKKRKNK